MKNKKTIFGTILLLFAITGICNIPNVSADSWNDVEIHHSSYIYVSYTLEYKDELNLYVSSSGTINVYIMDANQFSTLQNSGGLIWEYHVRWKDVTYLDIRFIVQENNVYYVVLYNKNLIFKRTVDFSITIDYYYEPDPYVEPTPENFFLGWLLFIIFPIIVIAVIVAVVVRKRKRKITEEVIEPERTPIKTYCSKCGTEILGELREFCFNCGTKIN